MRTMLLLALLNVVAFTGCAIAPSGNDQYFALVHELASDKTPYTMLEQGAQKTFYQARASADFYWWPLPIAPADGTQTGPYLFTRRVYWWDLFATWEIAYPSEHRSLSILEKLARGMSPLETNELKQNQVRRRWIISNDPMIIALGTDLLPTEPGWKIYSIPESADLDRSATELLILERWPGKLEHWDPNERDAFQALLATRVRRQELPSPLTLKQILAKENAVNRVKKQ